ncbi:MAG: multicopper oxidase family protein [Deltaproteobacteria bacterium]|nr:MAG: multicopper oxidase family protein [Deltaproteobacteria bacterium]
MFRRWSLWVVFFACWCLLWKSACTGSPAPNEGVQESQSRVEAEASEPVLETTDASQPEPRSEPQMEPEREPVPEPQPEPQPEPKAELPPRPPPVPFPSSYPPIEGGTILKDENPDPNIVEVKLEAKAMMHQLTPKHNFEIYAFNGMLPGPIIKAKLGDQLIVHFTNSLKEPTTIHWHGQRVPEAMDGAPMVQAPVKPGETFTYRFKIRDAGTYWYHPHVRSHYQVEKGLYGMLIVQETQPLAFTRERAVVLDDILLTDSGLAPFNTTDDDKIKGRLGSQLLINGKPVPVAYQAKTGERERWRLVNTANARVFRLEIKGAVSEVRVIGVDSGLLAQPYVLRPPFTLAPGQRLDLEVMYEKPGKVEFIAEVAVGAKYEERSLLSVDVTGDAVSTPMAYPQYPVIPPLPTRQVTRQETLTFEQLQTPDSGGNHWSINGQVNPGKPLFEFKTGDVVLFTLRHLGGPSHPFHLHGQFFEIVSRNGLPVTDEPGLRDTVLVTLQERVVIKAYLDNPGRWMFHCHNLEHAAFGMMAHILVK